MVFSSIIFLSVFLPLTLVMYYLPFGITYKNTILILMSIVFYTFGEPLYILLMLGSVLMNYIFGRLLGKESGKRKLILVISVIVNIGLLGVFKYTGFFAQTINSIFGNVVPVPSIKLPIGISFYTFQAMSYVVDVYRNPKEVQKSLPKLLLYISFFPQLIAGPIVRYKTIDQQLSERGKRGAADPAMIEAGVLRFIKGLSKKVILANAMASVADKIYALDVSNMNALVGWTGAIAYVFQIYFDFSGYSDMAIGLAKMFGFEFLENFDHPYSSLSIKEFWRRWHISLSSWFKEYVYIPLGGNRKGRARMWVNKLIVFFLTGFWHGANWTFIVWGLFHGMFLVIEDLVGGGKKKEEKKIAFPVRVVRNLYVWLVATVGFVFFRADSISAAGIMLKNMFTGFFASRASLATVMELLNPYTIFIMVLCLIFSYPLSTWAGKKLHGKRGLEPVMCVLSLVLLMFCIMNLASNAYNPFIYFRF